MLVSENSECVAMNSRAVEMELGEGIEILFCDFDNPVFYTPYLIAGSGINSWILMRLVDRSKKAIVLSVRGTLSLADVIVDATATDHNIEYPGLGSL